VELEQHHAVGEPICQPGQVQLWLLTQPQIADAEAKVWQRAQLQQVLASLLGVQVTEVELGANAMGQLAVRPTARIQTPPALSVSDTEGLLAIAVAASGAVGVDVESAASVEQVRAALATFSTASEREELAGSVDASVLLGWWTAKEALLKAVGVGIRLGPENIGLRRHGGEGWRVETLLDRAELARGWSLRSGAHWLGARHHVWTVAASTGAAIND
jgi:phosphopantetheinyl transferase